MLPDRVSNPGPPSYESGALPIALRGPALNNEYRIKLSELVLDLEMRECLICLINIHEVFCDVIVALKFLNFLK